MSVDNEPLVSEKKKPSLLSRLCAGLSRSAQSISTGLSGVFKKKIDEDTLELLEKTLIDADFGPQVTQELLEDLKKEKYSRDADSEHIKQSLCSVLTGILEPCERSLEELEPPSHKPFVIMMTGVNGAGKTTTAAKMAHHLQKEGKKVALVAADTFRAAAVAQLKIWGDRLNIPTFTTREGGDSAALAFSSIERARQENIDVLIIDTAGRLQNKESLMAELSKLIRVIKKCDETAPHANLLVLDASIGQNTLQQVDVFRKLVHINGLVMTKLDGTAKGGTLISIAQKTSIPIVMIGFGEQIEDITPFKAQEFSKSLLSID